MSYAVASFAAQLALTPPPGSAVQTSAVLLPGQLPGEALPSSWPPWLVAVTQAQGITHLASHQRQMLEALQQGRHVCLMAPTGAGRGVGRLLALYQGLAVPQRGHALCIFPSKLSELAHHSSVATWNAALAPEQRLSVAMYDGDTPGTQRRILRQAPPRLLLTTPEMLHTGILPYHGGWRAFFQDLRYVVLADVHLCGSALGTHLAHLLRRVQRLALHYGTSPQYLLTSAPLANMAEVAQTLSGQACSVIAGTAWPRQPQHRLMLTTTTAADLLHVCSALQQACQRAALPPLILAPEALLPQLHAAGLETALAHDTPVAAVRSQSWQSLICLGLPGSLAHLHDYLDWLGSGSLPSLGCLVLSGETPQERFLMHYPALYEASWPPSLALYPSNPDMARYHLHCAAAELALAAGERYAGIHGVGGFIRQLAEAQVLTRHTVSSAWVARERAPHRRARLRAYEPGVAMVHSRDGQVIARLAAAQAFRVLFEGAWYTQAGTTWQVQRLLPERRRVLVQPVAASAITRACLHTALTERQIEASVVKDNLRCTYGACQYTATLEAYERLDPHTRARRSVHLLAQPQQRQYRTQALWLAAEHSPSHGESPDAVAWHTLVHAVLASLPLFVSERTPGLRAGVYGEATALEAVFSDAAPGGTGLSALLYQARERVLRAALLMLLHCDGGQGCRRCLTACGCDTCASQVGLERQAGLVLLQQLLGETVPTFASLIEPPWSGQRQAPRLVYLVLSTQKSAEEVGGWQHKHLLGLGVAVTYDTSTGRSQVYSAETVAALLASLQSADLVIGFNTRDFDYQVLQPYASTSLAALPTLAVLDEVQHVLGFRLSLRHLVRETLGIERPDDSRQTLTWYQEGDRERIVQQCQRDLDLLRQLVHSGAQSGTIFYRDQAGVRTAVPVHWQRCSDAR
ncbi:MAG: DEAD/DEAH box helicase [Candidatus Tectimicrobiota bacterium]